MRNLTVMGEIYVRFTAEANGCELSQAQHFSRSVGGSAALVSAAAAKLGLSARLIAATGADAFGNYLCRTLAAAGVRTDTVLQVKNAATPKLFVAFSCDSVPELLFDRSAAAELQAFGQQPDADRFSDTDALFFSSGGLRSASARAAQLAAIRYASARNAIICYDYALPADVFEDDAAVQGMDAFLSQAQIVACGTDALPHLLGEQMPVELLKQRMHGRRKLWIVFTESGVEILTKSQQLRVNTASELRHGGAREAFLTGFLYCAMQESADPRMLAGMPPEHLTRWAAVAAVCASLCINGGFPTKSQLRMALRQQATRK